MNIIIWIIGFMYVAGRILRSSIDEKWSTTTTVGAVVVAFFLWPLMAGFTKYQISGSNTNAANGGKEE